MKETKKETKRETKKAACAFSYDAIKKDEEINLLIERGNQVLGELGFTEHSIKHAAKVAQEAARILNELGYSAHEIELSRIAGYMHDIGNSINRNDHAHTGGIMAYQILKERKMPLSDAILVATAIGQHDEATGTAVDAVSAALILADRTDMRRNRVRNQGIANFDSHDRVNYAALGSHLEIKKEKKVIQMELEMDDTMCTVMYYFEIFLQRMLMCKRAAEVLGCRFKFLVNGNKLC